MHHQSLNKSLNSSLKYFNQNKSFETLCICQSYTPRNLKKSTLGQPLPYFCLYYQIYLYTMLLRIKFLMCCSLFSQSDDFFNINFCYKFQNNNMNILFKLCMTNPILPFKNLDVITVTRIPRRDEIFSLPNFI